jgi:hypothetical protein
MIIQSSASVCESAVVESMHYGSITDVQGPQLLAQPSEVYLPS